MRDVCIVVIAIGFGLAIGGFNANAWRRDDDELDLLRFGPWMWRTGIGLMVLGAVAWAAVSIVDWPML